MQITSSSGIYKTNIYHNGCYLQLFGKKQWQSFLITYFILPCNKSAVP